MSARRATMEGPTATLLEWVRQTSQAPPDAVVDADTRLFDELGIESLELLALVDLVESLRGSEIDVELLRADNFATVNKIVETFLSPDSGTGSAPETREVERSGVRLRLTEWAGPSEATPIVIANAFGLHDEIVAATARALSAHARVVTWEARGTRAGPDEVGADCSVDAHVGDFEAVLAAAGLRSANVLGFCSGTMIALKAAVTLGERVSRVALANGVYRWTDDTPRTEIQRASQSTVPTMAKDVRYARLVREALDGGRAADFTAAAVDSDFAEFTRSVYETPEALHMYARSVRALWDEDVAAWAGRVVQPALVLASREDDRAHPASSEWLAGVLPDAELRVYDTGDHYDVWRPGSPAMEDLARFLTAG